MKLPASATRLQLHVRRVTLQMSPFRALLPAPTLLLPLLLLLLLLLRDSKGTLYSCPSLSALRAGRLR